MRSLVLQENAIKFFKVTKNMFAALENILKLHMEFED